MPPFIKKFGGIAIAIVVALGWFGFNTWKAKAGAPEVGECVVVTGSATDADVEVTDCDDSDVVYEVVAKGDCDQWEDEISTTVNGKEAVKLCLWPTVDAGTCLKPAANSMVETSDCASAGQDGFEIVATFDSSTGKCPKNSQPIVNELRDLKICVGPAKG